MREVLSSKLLGMAFEAGLWSIFGLKKGAVTPFEVLNDQDSKVNVVIDDYFRGNAMGIYPNNNTCTVWIASANLRGQL